MSETKTQEELEFSKRLDAENLRYWRERNLYQKKDSKREEKGLWYLGLSIISIIGGFSGLVYGLVGKDYVQKPYVVMALVMIAFGMSIVIGGFGRVKE